MPSPFERRREANDMTTPLATRSDNPSGKSQKRLDPRSNEGCSAGQSRLGEQRVRSRSLFAETGDRLVNEGEQRKNVFEQQRYKQQKELEGVAKVDYSNPDVPKLRGGMKQGDKRTPKEILTEEEIKSYNSGIKKQKYERTKKEDISIEMHCVSRNKTI